MKGSYTIIVLFVVICLGGILAIPHIPVQFDQQQSEHALIVSYRWPNASPDALERQVAAPIEGMLGTIRGVKGIRSSSEYHTGQIVLELDESVDDGRIRFEVSSCLRRLYQHLPSGLEFPEISFDHAQSFGARAYMSLQVSADVPIEEIRVYVESTLKPKLARINGIRSLRVHGGEPEELVMEYDPALLRRAGLNKEDIVNAIAEHYQSFQLGWLTGEAGSRQSVIVSPPGSRTGPDSLVVSNNDGRLLRLGDLGPLRKRGRQPSGVFRINGKSAVLIELTPLPGVNQIATAASVRQSLHALSKAMPPGYQIRIGYDAYAHVYDNLRQIAEQAAATCLCIVLLMMLVFRSWKILFILALAVVASVLVGAMALFTFRINIDLISIASVPMAIGLAAANAIIAYIFYNSTQSKKIVLTLFGGGVTMIAVMSVFWVFPNDTRAELASFATVLIVAQSAVFCVCLWFIPAMMTRLDRQAVTGFASGHERYRAIWQIYRLMLTLIVRYRLVFGACFLLTFGFPLFLMPKELDSKWKLSAYYNRAVGSDFFQKDLKPTLDVALGGFLRPFYKYVFERSYYATSDETALYVVAGLPNNSTIEQMDAVLQNVEEGLSHFQGIDRVITQASSGQSGIVTVYFRKPYDVGSLPKRIKSAAVSVSNQMSGVDWKIFGVGQGFGVNANESATSAFNVIMKGYGHRKLEELAIRLQDQLLRNPRITAVDIHRLPGSFTQKELYTYKLMRDETYWSAQGVSKQKLFLTLDDYDARPTTDTYMLVDDAFTAIKIRPKVPADFDIAGLWREPLPLPDSSTLKMEGHGHYERVKVLSSIRKENQQYVRQVSFDYLGSNRFGEAFLKDLLAKFQSELPSGYSVENAASDGMEREGRNYGLIALSLVLIFITGSMLFESLHQALVLLVSIVLSYVGIFIAFYGFDVAFDQGGYSSFFLTSCATSLIVMMVLNEYNLKLRNSRQTKVFVYLDVVKFVAKPVSCFGTCLSICLCIYLWYYPAQPFWYSFGIGSVGGILAGFLIVLFVLPAFLIGRNR